mgnify:CR=1 FL=1
MVLDDQTRLELVQLVKTAVNEAVEAHPLSPDEVIWVRMAIQAEAERAELRKAIIQKTLSALALMAVIAVCGFIWDGIRTHIAVK